MLELISFALSKNKRELLLTGNELKGHEEEFLKESAGLEELVDLNLLRISKSALTKLPESIGSLTNLVNLVCQHNKLESIPASIGNLEKLKMLDLSNNMLTELPDSIGNITSLMTLNVSCNQLTSLPVLTRCKMLATLDASHNVLTEFPTIAPELSLLADVILSGNKIEAIPAHVEVLAALKNLHIDNNNVLQVPGNLIACPKLKAVNLIGNAIKDRRLRKLVENANTKPDQVLKYIKQHCTKESFDLQPPSVNSNQDNELSNDDAPVTIEFRQPTINVVPPEELLQVIVTSEALSLRPYLVCCAIRGLDLQNDGYKKFIAKQNKLHDGVCNKRLNSTIATHDLSKMMLQSDSEDQRVREGLLFTTYSQDVLKFVPLNRRSKPITLERFVRTLHQEAENHRKQLKSNATGGLYKYLDLVKGWQKFPCLMDAQDNVMSVPPLTNGDISKISPSTSDMLLEVSSDKSLKHCKDAMTELVMACLETSEDSTIKLQQVRVIDDCGGLRCIYPASDDLRGLKNVNVVRPH